MLTTRKSLIFRIRDANDADAWSNFVEIYGPLVYRYGRRRGLQDADATDLSQAVLTEVAQCIGRFAYDAKLGRFRNWLMVIARYKLSRMLKRANDHIGSGDTRILQLLDQQPTNDDLNERWEAEYQEHLFRWAADKVRQEIEEKTWLAFWYTAVENRKPNDVAESLGLKVGSVYVAKSRVLLRIKDKIASVDESFESSQSDGMS